MSDIPRARALIVEVLQLSGVDAPAKLKLRHALALMRREPGRRDDGELEQITPEMVVEVCHLTAFSRLTYRQIADQVGLRDVSRVSEIVHGAR